MTLEQKELLLKDLCARLPYGVKCSHKNKDIFSLTCIDLEYNYIYVKDGGFKIGEPEIKHIKPYLFPLSSMTEEQFEELKVFADLTYEGNTLELVEWNDNCKTLEFWLEEIPSHCVIKVFDWLNKNHFDYRGLIPMGLAIDATGLNIY